MSMLAGTPGNDALRARWKWFVAFGVLFAILGIVALTNVIDATLVTTIFIGYLLIIGGITQIFGAFTTSGGLGTRALLALIGVLYLLVGFDIIADPLAGAITLTVVLGFMMIVEGVVRIGAAFTERPEQWLLIALVGVVNILLGLWLITNIPFSGVAIGFFVGLDLLMTGITWITLGWAARSSTA